MGKGTAAPAGAGHGEHGAAELPSVTVRGYNLELRDEDGFVGDKANRAAFTDHLDRLRRHLGRTSEDPLAGDTARIGKRELDALLSEGDARQAGLLLSAIEEFAQSLAFVIRRFLRAKSWSGVERVVVGGGFRDSRVGQLAIGRASVILQTDGCPVELVPIRHHPDEAGLLGAAHLAPSWMFEGHDSILAVDIGGSKIRVGLVALRQGKAADLSKVRVAESELWRHADEEPSRDQAIERIGAMLRAAIVEAEKSGLKLAPFIGVGCPGLIQPDGAIDRGTQNLPGNWEHERFNLVDCVRALVPRIGDHESRIVMHNDAVIQGLSEMPVMQDVQHWAVLTIGTGLGNAAYANRAEPKARKTKAGEKRRAGGR